MAANAAPQTSWFEDDENILNLTECISDHDAVQLGIRLIRKSSLVLAIEKQRSDIPIACRVISRWHQDFNGDDSAARGVLCNTLCKCKLSRVASKIPFFISDDNSRCAAPDHKIPKRLQQKSKRCMTTANDKTLKRLQQKTIPDYFNPAVPNPAGSPSLSHKMPTKITDYFNKENYQPSSSPCSAELSKTSHTSITPTSEPGGGTDLAKPDWEPDCQPVTPTSPKMLCKTPCSTPFQLGNIQPSDMYTPECGSEKFQTTGKLYVKRSILSEMNTCDNNL